MLTHPEDLAALRLRNYEPVLGAFGVIAGISGGTSW